MVIYFFIHIPRTAGTYLEGLIEKSEYKFINLFKCNYGLHETLVKSKKFQEFKNIILSEKDDVIISGHIGCDLINRLKTETNLNIKMFTILRDPLDKVPSMFIKNSNRKNYGLMKFIGSNIEINSLEYWKKVDMILEDIKRFIDLKLRLVHEALNYNNYMTRIFAGLPLDQFIEITDDHYKTANNNLKNITKCYYIDNYIDIQNLNSLLKTNFEVTKKGKIPKYNFTNKTKELIIKNNKYDILLMKNHFKK